METLLRIAIIFGFICGLSIGSIGTILLYDYHMKELKWKWEVNKRKEIRCQKKN